jgi:phosphoglycerate kinase
MPINAPSIDDYQLAGKRVLLRVDINSPVDPDTKRIADETRIDKSLPTIRDLAEAGARLVIIAHQGDTLDYHNLISLEEHSRKLAEKLDRPVGFIDDVAGPAARARIEELENGDILVLENVRFLTEEVSTFESSVKLTPEEMTATYLVRSLAPLFDLYVNDAFAAAHRNAPSMVAFQQLLPFAAGRLLVSELEALDAVAGDPVRPCYFVLGGLKISDAFGMLRQVLAEGTADLVLTTGVTGLVMLLASGQRLGEPTERFIADRSLDVFVPEAREHLSTHPGKILLPVDRRSRNGLRQRTGRRLRTRSRRRRDETSVVCHRRLTGYHRDRGWRHGQQCPEVHRHRFDRLRLHGWWCPDSFPERTAAAASGGNDSAGRAESLSSPRAMSHHGSRLG